MNQYSEYLEGTEQEDLCGAFGADPNDVRD
jgi:hypothetical protein